MNAPPKKSNTMKIVIIVIVVIVVIMIALVGGCVMLIKKGLSEGGAQMTQEAISTMPPALENKDQEAELTDLLTKVHDVATNDGLGFVALSTFANRYKAVMTDNSVSEGEYEQMKTLCEDIIAGKGSISMEKYPEMR